MRKALRICATSGCPTVSSGPYCPACEAKRPKPIDARPSAPARGYDSKWRRYSESYRRAHPWCEPCRKDGRRTPAEAVDHVRPVAGPRDPAFWTPENHQSICRSCHAAKTQAEGKTYVDQPTPIGASPYRWRFA